MLLIILAFLMKISDISKMHGKRYFNNYNNNNNNSCHNNANNSNNSNNNNNNDKMSPARHHWQHVAKGKANTSNSSSTSSGCDSAASSSSSSKENSYQNKLQQHNVSLTPQQLQQLRYYQQLQQQQLQLLQQQLIQRKRLQQQLREQGVDISHHATSKAANKTSSSVALTCNQQYLRQMRLQQQQQQHRLYHMQPAQQQRLQKPQLDNFMFQNKNFNKNINDILNNNNNEENYLQQQLKQYNYNVNNGSNGDGDNNGGGAALPKGPKSYRGMTEFSTNNDINNKTHLSSQPLQNSPRHHYIPYPTAHNNSPHTTNINTQQQQPHHNNTTTFNAQFNKQFTQTLKQQQQHLINNCKNNQTTTASSSPSSVTTTTTNTTTINSSANNANKLNELLLRSPSSAASSVTHSPTHYHHQAQNYRKPFNSPQNSPFVGTANTGGVGCAQQQNYQQRRKLPFLTHTQYQQHLNDLLSQQQHLQQQQQQLLLSKDHTDEELSEESLKQNVAIVLSNLDRYNNALRSIILNEQVLTNTASSSVFYDESDLNFLNCGNNNLQQQQQNSNNMATAITPESDYNSNATTPGSRSNNMLPYESSTGGNMLPNQAQQHLVGFTHTTGGGGGGLNNACLGGVGGGNAYMGNNLNCSLASSHDFTHDNSDYQWFLDYGYRDGCGGMQRSVLSSLSASYNGLGDLIYEDLAKNLDANLAEVDMESFRAEDIHSLLSQLPSYCKSLGGNRLQQSLMMQQHLMPSQNMPLGGGVGGGLPLHHQQMMAANTMSQTSTTSTNDLIDNSFCKSELLFSPVKESHISVDSLDMDGYPDDGDIILTCKANKDNYTIAFEGSVLYSDESFYEPNEIAMKNKQNFINLHSNLDDIVKRKSLEVSMSRSEQPQPCNQRNKLQKSHTTQLQRYPSGNNNNAPDAIIISRPALQQLTNAMGVRKSSSLPNLRDDCQEVMILSQTQIHPSQHTEAKVQQQQQQLNVSQAITTSNMEANLKCRNLLPMCQIPITANSTAASIDERLNILTQTAHHQQQQHHHHQQQSSSGIHHHKASKHRCCCGGSSSGASNHSNSMASNNGSATLTSHHSNKAHISGSTSSGSSNPPAFNLVKLFIKQKSTNCSLEDQPSAHTCMDVSSGCWPSSDANNSSTSSSLEQRLRKKSMNDSGKGSALSRHDEEVEANAMTFQMDASSSTPKKHQQQQQQRRSSLFYDEEPSSSSTGSLTATNSPAHRRRSMPLRNPALNHLAVQHNNNSSASLLSSDNTSEQLTQIQLSSGQEGSSSASSQSASSAKAERNKQRRSREASRPISNASSSEMITRSMQTSCGSLSTRSSLSDRFRCVPPSFLEKLNNLGEERQAPIYVIYPNYALPDLGFVKTSATPDVIFSPFNYKNSIGSTSATSSSASLKKRFSLMSGSDEDEILKTMDYKHVQDWHSLVTLLPGDYRRRLKHIPEVNGVLSHLEAELSQKPLFCLTPPVRRNRPHICDCNQYFHREQAATETTGGGASSSSGSSQQPSSGYRGSSTMLTDSEFESGAGNGTMANASGDNLKQMYVYQYEQQRMDSGVEMSPKVQSTTPVPMPRGILRKSSSAVRNKRNSMIEHEAKQTKLEKRRSLQEPPHHYHIGSAEELAEVFEEEVAGCELYASPQPRSERLSRKDLDARVRAENFLSSLPRNELKYYAEIAAILESSEPEIQYDAAALKKEVSRALSQQKKVSFNDKEGQANAMVQMQAETRQRFSTPPNSPNISMATAGHSNNAAAALRLQNHPSASPGAAAAAVAAPRRCSHRDELDKRKSESNRFKRLQIQWELMSKDSSMLKELVSNEQTKSGGSTPTSAQAAANAAAASKSRIPRPVSYPAGKRTDMYKDPPTHHHHVMTDNTTTTTTTTTLNHKYANVNTKIPKPPRISPQIARISNQADPTKTTRSPSRLQPPKRYSMTTTPPSATNVGAVMSSPSTPTTPGGGGSANRARTPNSRVAVTAPNTPKKRVQSPRTIPRVR
uniref:Uncharacterized protein n=1 Tax=Stomoxys calcitrans TaxID=35570 RepID=A0A1I8NMA4_STOCA